MNKNTVSVLGEEYTIHLLNPEDDAALNRCQGYTDESRPRDKRLRYMAVAERAVASFQQWLNETAL